MTRSSCNSARRRSSRAKRAKGERGSAPSALVEARTWPVWCSERSRCRRRWASARRFSRACSPARVSALFSCASVYRFSTMAIRSTCSKRRKGEAGEVLARAIQGEVRARLPSLGRLAVTLQLPDEPLLLGDDGDGALPRGGERLLHLADELGEHALGVLDLVEQGVDVGGEEV